MTFSPTGKGVNPITGKEYTDKYKNLAKKWSTLPAYERKDDMINAIKNNQITLIASGTGSGKTLLTPRFALEVFDFKAKIAITLPKQILTISNASFQADISDLTLGKEVGYVYKGSDKKFASDENLLVYATDGTIVSKLLKDPELKDYNCVIIDEAHERKVQIDLLLYLLKQTCMKRKDFRLIIMSATVNEIVFQDYFKEQGFAYFNIGSKTNYPITSIFLEKPIGEKIYMDKGFEIVNELLKKNDGDILFFVTSIQETIDSCKKINMETTKLSNNVYCAEVYAGMDNNSQEMAQDEHLYKEKTNKNRKIVFSTNVAESSLTISGIKYVIDSGLELLSYYDPERRCRVLEKKFITQAQAKQRMGRAGRTGPGTCYHLYTKSDFESMIEFPLPTIKISDLSGECLKLLNLPIISSVEKLRETLKEFIEPPDKKYINDAISILTRLGLIHNNSITELGKIVSEMQVEPMQGVALYTAYTLNCMKEVAAIIAMLDAMKNNISELFIKINTNNKSNKNELNEKITKAKNSFGDKEGDHITILKIFSHYIKIKSDSDKLKKWTQQNFLKKHILEKAYLHFKKIRGIAIRILSETKYDKIENLMDYPTKNRIITSLMSGYNINIAFIKSRGYDTERVEGATLSKDSWLYKNMPNKVLYSELFSMNKRTEIQIVSNISKKTQELFEHYSANNLKTK